MNRMPYVILDSAYSKCLACFVTVFLLPGPVFCVGLVKLPGERRIFHVNRMPYFILCLGTSELMSDDTRYMHPDADPPSLLAMVHGWRDKAFELLLRANGERRAGKRTATHLESELAKASANQVRRRIYI